MTADDSQQYGGDDTIAEEDLVDAAVPSEEIVIASRDASVETVHCAMCGATAEEVELPTGYANPVCDGCDGLAVNRDGAEPWDGWRPGEKPEFDDNAIHLAPDQGENPVFIAGVKCWRRYRFGGWITRRDAFDCDSLEEFQARHRIDGHPIHAFNVSQPDGIEIPDEHRRELLAHRKRLRELLAVAEDLHDQPENAELAAVVQGLVQESELEIGTDSTDPEEMEESKRRAYAEAVQWTVEDRLREPSLAALCERYYGL